MGVRSGPQLDRCKELHLNSRKNSFSLELHLIDISGPLSGPLMAAEQCDLHNTRDLCYVYIYSVNTGFK